MVRELSVELFQCTGNRSGDSTLSVYQTHDGDGNIPVGVSRCIDLHILEPMHRNFILTGAAVGWQNTAPVRVQELLMLAYMKEMLKLAIIRKCNCFNRINNSCLLFQFPGCQEACRFHAEASTRAQQAQPVIHTKGEGVIRVSGGLAVWPRPSSSSTTTPLIYVVMRKSQSGPWRQVIQTLDLTTRVPLNSDQPGSMLRVLVVDPQGLVTIYSPDEASVRDGKKKKKTINTEIKATTSKSTGNDLIEPWTLREISLIHQKVLVIGEIAWEPKATRGVYLVTWEVDGGGLKGNLFTDSTCVTLSLWPDTIYHIQVELVSRTPGVENLKSEMMDLDTGRAQKVSTESQEDLNMIQGDVREDVDFNSPLLSVLVGAVRGEKSMHRWHSMELVLGCSAAIVLFSLILLVTFWRCRHHSALDNLITGSTSIRSHKLVEDYTGYSDTA
ncbi:uncharacterized protein LOC116168031 [Photinus pyralis]|uniref:uncharacterized protein LOC116168031 n=1 Tax=Photinus pyralis TaxID=7054 RepID=UPI001266F1FF|nr:uncharacterized protein LOC116168031 [Photinus pyralis]